MYLIGIPFADDLTNNLVNGYFEKKSSIFDDLNNNWHREKITSLIMKKTPILRIITYQKDAQEYEGDKINIGSIISAVF